ncbi:MAG TPA: hypothetical protein VK464_20345 [Symbiobacteriaceae bacterium]|nr:hypothetical protein [Symbiobacteriaceae bacterium]
MNENNYPSRIARSRAELAARPPRVLPRVLGTLPILALALLVAVTGSFAWFTSAGTLAANFKTGEWSTLMTQSAESVSANATAGSPYTMTFTITSTAGVTLPLQYDWTPASPTGAPTVKFYNAANQEVTSIAPGQTVTVKLTGTASANFTATLNVYIGSARYDTHPFGVAVNVAIVVTPADATCTYKTGTAAPKIDWLHILTIPAMTTAIPMTASVRQSSANPVPDIYIWAEGLPHPVGNPPPSGQLFRSMNFTTSTTSETKIWLYQQLVVDNTLTYVEVTLVGQNPADFPEQKHVAVLGHADDINALVRSGGFKCGDPMPVLPYIKSVPKPSLVPALTPAKRPDVTPGGTPVKGNDPKLPPRVITPEPGTGTHTAPPAEAIR